MGPVIQTSHQPFGHVMTFCGLTWETCYSENLCVHLDETTFSAGQCGIDILFHHAHHVVTSSQNPVLAPWTVLQTSWTAVFLCGDIFSSFVAFRADKRACRFDAPITRMWLDCLLFDKRTGRKWQTVLDRSNVPVLWAIGVKIFMPILVSSRPRCHLTVLKRSNYIC
jgi:hypothetical protein